jgi:inosose dehydratase
VLGAAGGETLVVVAVQDVTWSRPAALDRDGWRRLGQHLRAIEEAVGELEVQTALHPHFATLIQTREDIERTLDVSPDTGWCLDTGHMLIGGADPGQFVFEHGERVRHVHLKDVDSVRAGELTVGTESLQRATQNGLFAALGEGDAPLRAVLEGLDRHGYDGWLVLEQDRAITAERPAAGGGPADDAKASIQFLENFARRTQEVRT